VNLLEVTVEVKGCQETSTVSSLSGRLPNTDRGCSSWSLRRWGKARNKAGITGIQPDSEAIVG
jgi:hypothetical protein